MTEITIIHDTRRTSFVDASCVLVSARPLPECFDDVCICPLGYDYDHLEQICIPLPGYRHDTMGPSGSDRTTLVLALLSPRYLCSLMCINTLYIIPFNELATGLAPLFPCICFNFISARYISLLMV